ncbi:MAG: acyl-CoA synthetase [Alphaproteobacteria bacterium]
MLEACGSYEDVRAAFRWRIPPRYNIAVDVCDRHPSDRVALIVEDETGVESTYTFGAIRSLSNRCANLLAARGITAGDRVGILLSQGVELPIVHLATYKLGAIALPLFTLFGPEALAHRLKDSGAKVVVTDRIGAEKIASIHRELPALAHLIIVDGEADALWPLLDRASDAFTPVDTAADDPALILYTSGTTGPPKGALHAHRVVLGHGPGVAFPHEFFPQAGDRFWTPADWAWAGGLLNVLLSSWQCGVTVVAHRARKFDPEAAYALMARQGVRNTFLPPTALKLMRQARPRHPVALRTVASGGEPLGQELVAWGREALGVTINEFYGQTECNLVLGNCAHVMPIKPGSMGRPIPGHAVAVIGEDGTPCRPGQSGAIAILRPDPVMFLGYWRNEDATARKFIGDWMTTGDLGQMDEDGYFWFLGREDDVITSGAYRIGPGEIEDCLLKHPAVAMAAAVGVPDPLRTEIVKAFIVTKPGERRDGDLARAIQDFVKTRLAAHEYPRLIEFVDALPMTATGKIIRRALRERSIASDGRETS